MRRHTGGSTSRNSTRICREPSEGAEDVTDVSGYEPRAAETETVPRRNGTSRGYASGLDERGQGRLLSGGRRHGPGVARGVARRRGGRGVGKGALAEVEAVEEVVGVGVPVGHRGKVPLALDRLQNRCVV